MTSRAFDTLHAAVRHYGSEQPGLMAYCYPGQEDLSYGELLHRANGLAQLLIERSDAGDRVIIALPSSPDFMVSFLACGLAGVVAVPTFLPVAGKLEEHKQNLQRIIDSAAAKLILLNSSEERLLQPLLGEQGVDAVVVDELNGLPDGSNTRHTALAMILYTSGSTGWPKGVQISHAMLINNYAAFAERFSLSQQDKVGTWLPNCHIAGFYLRTLALPLGGCTVVFPANEFIQRPAYWLEVISDHGICISAAPNFAYDILARLTDTEIRQDLDLSGWKMAITGGEVVREGTVEGILSQLAPFGFQPDSFFPYYGMTETLCSSIRPPNSQLTKLDIDKDALKNHSATLSDEADSSIRVISNGTPLLPGSVRIVNSETQRECAANQVGEIWIRNDTVTPGYWEEDELNQELCNAEMLEVDDRYFRTGDLGFLHAGELFITGRIKELIILNGKNYYPKDIEATILDEFRDQALLPVALACQHNGQECLGVLVECEAAADTSGLASRLRSLINRKHGVVAELIRFYAAGELPRTSTEKLQRQLCRQLIEESVDEQAPFSILPLSFEKAVFDKQSEAQQQARFQQYFLHLCSEVVKRDCRDVSPSNEVACLGLDSLQLVQFLARCRGVFGIELDIASFYEGLSIATLCKRCVALLNGEQPSSDQAALNFEPEMNRVIGTVYAEMPPATKTNTVFLTGATGFLGSYLLRDILLSTSWRVICLVRGASAELARQRVLRSLQALDPQWPEHEALARLEVVCGEIDRPRLGIAREKYQALAQRVDRVIHNAANVNFVAPFNALRSVNVDGVANIIEFACSENLKQLHYVSTTAVYNSAERDQYRLIGEQVSLSKGEDIYSGYAQSKWAGEKLLDVAAAAGVPVSIFRPGLVMGAEKTGHCHTDDFLCRLIKGCLQMGAFPALNTQLDITPVDYVAAAIVEIAGKHPNRRLGGHYNLVNPSHFSVRELAQWLAGQGYDLEIEDSGNWHHRLAGIGEDNALYPLLPFLLQKRNAGTQTILEFFSSRPLNIGRENVNAASVQHCPQIDQQLLEVYLDYFQRIDFIPKPQELIKPKRISA